MARGRTSGENEFALGVQAEGVGDSFGGHLADGRQSSVGGVYGEARNAVVALVGNVQEFLRSGNLNLGAGVPYWIGFGSAAMLLQNTSDYFDR